MQVKPSFVSQHKLTDWTETYFRIPSEAEIELPQ